MNTNRAIGVLFIGAFPAVMFACAWWIWPEPFAWVCIAGGVMWLPFLLAGLGVMPVNSERDIDESAEIETIHIGLIALDQAGNHEAKKGIAWIRQCTEHHPAYEDNSGVRRWKVSPSDNRRKQLTNSDAIKFIAGTLLK